MLVGGWSSRCDKNREPWSGVLVIPRFEGPAGWIGVRSVIVTEFVLKLDDLGGLYETLLFGDTHEEYEESVCDQPVVGHALRGACEQGAGDSIGTPGP